MKKFTPLLLCFLIVATVTRAQTTLSAGDLVFTSFNANPTTGVPDTFSIVLLTPISSTTVIYFSDRGYNPAMSTYQAYGSTEGTIKWEAASALPIGTEIQFAGLGTNAATVNGVSNGTVTQVLGGHVASGLSLGNASGDQIYAFQGGNGDPTVGGVTRIAAIHFASCSGVTSDANWDGATCTGPTYSGMLPGLTGGTNAFWSGAYMTHGKFVCTGTPYSTVAALRAAIMNRANWIFSNSISTAAFDIPSGCTFYSTCTAPSITSQPSNRSICGTQNTSFSVTASGTGLSYQWQVNFGTGWTNYVNASSSTATLSLTNVSTSYNGYLFRCYVTGTCGSTTSNSGTLTVGSLGQWSGAASSAWSNTANWSCATVPGANTNVTIPSAASNMPLIDIANAICNDLTLASGASLAFSGSTNTLEVKGAITNSGTINGSSGKIIFSGTAQSIPAGTYRELSMNGAGNKTLGGAVTISNTLTLTSGHIVLGNHNLTIANTGSISGGSNNSFIVTSGTGALHQQNIGTGGRTGSVVFPVGVNATSYTPLAINNAGTADEFGVGVLSNVYTAYAGHTATGNALSEMVVNRTWTISEATIGGSNATLSFQWNASNETTGFDRSRCYGSHYEDYTWKKGATGAASGSDPYSISMSSVTSFSPFAVGTPGSTLPLTLQSFQANTKSNDVELSWSTSNEVNTAGFEVERSADGVVFTKTGFVASKENNSSITCNYNFIDRQLAAGTYKYRLKMVDKDGSHTFSGTIAVRIEAVAVGYELFPNPVTGSSIHIRSLQVQSEAVTIKIADLSGRIWHSEKVAAAKINSGNHAITVRQLPAGNYLVIITGSREDKKQIVQFTK